MEAPWQCKPEFNTDKMDDVYKRDAGGTEQSVSVQCQVSDDCVGNLSDLAALVETQ